MLDSKLIVTDTEAVKEALSKREPMLAEQVANVATALCAVRIGKEFIEAKRAERNNLSKSIKSPEQAQQVKQAVQLIKEDIESREHMIADAETMAGEILYSLPNIPSPETPVGRSEEDNRLVKVIGRPPIIEHPIEHGELGIKLGLLDFELTSEICGARFSTLIGFGAKLARALVQFMLDEADSAGYIEHNIPSIVRGETLRGTGQLPKFAEDQFALEAQQTDGIPNNDRNDIFGKRYLIPTAEVPLTALYASKSPFRAEDLPLRLCAHTPCFRAEAGSAGRDTRGLIRQHQFEKIELVHICMPDQAAEEHERLTSHAEGLLEKLGLHYRRTELCTGDLGFSAARCYDLEVWFPAQGKFREISSCSWCTDFQARRLGFKYKPNANSKSEFVHTLNGSGLAVGRTWAALLENYQLPDGNGFTVPDVIRPYLGGLQELRC